MFYEPDGHIITVGVKRFRREEGFFQLSFCIHDSMLPNGENITVGASALTLRWSVVLAKLPASGFHVISFLSNMECDVDVRKKWFAQCRAVGGTAMVQEACERMTKELTVSASSTIKIKVDTPPDSEVITVGAQNASVMRMCCLAMFSASGIYVVSFHSNMECDDYIRWNLFVDVAVSNGTCMLQEVLERMTKELTAPAPSAMKFRWLIHQTGSSSLLAPNASVTRKCCSNPSLQPAESMSATVTSARNCTPRSCCQVARA